MEQLEEYTVGSFFAGVGGVDLGFEQTGHFEVVYANEIDSFPARTYEENFSHEVDVKDIREVKGDEIPDFDVMVGGFPCQAFSIAGYRQGFDDEKGRGTLFYELCRIIREKRKRNKQPKVVFFENVKNLVKHDDENTFRVILELLSDLGYSVKYKVLNACEYGNIPQNRERIYIVGFLDKEDHSRFNMPAPIELTTRLRDCVDFEHRQDDKYYYTPRCSFYEQLVEGMPRTDTIYQWRRRYVRENKNHVCPTLTANMGTGGHNVPLILTDSHEFRKLTPRECFNLQGFPEDFNLPEDMSNTRLYKQAGNSVTVPVIRRIADNIYSAISQSE